LTSTDRARLPVVEVRAACECADVDIEALRLYVQAVMADLGHHAMELSILLADDAYVRELNRRYRGVDRTTNVLAFPQQDSPPAAPANGALLGDVVISVEKAMRDSERTGFSLSDEIKKLVVHGLLHLSGYDHRTAPEARRMRQIEQEVIERTK